MEEYSLQILNLHTIMIAKNRMYDNVYITLLKICYCTWNNIKIYILFGEHNFKLSSIISTSAFLRKVN